MKKKIFILIIFISYITNVFAITPLPYEWYEEGTSFNQESLVGKVISSLGKLLGDAIEASEESFEHDRVVKNLPQYKIDELVERMQVLKTDVDNELWYKDIEFIKNMKYSVETLQEELLESRDFYNIELSGETEKNVQDFNYKNEVENRFGNLSPGFVGGIIVISAVSIIKHNPSFLVLSSLVAIISFIPSVSDFWQEVEAFQNIGQLENLILEVEKLHADIEIADEMIFQDLDEASSFLSALSN